ncbi:hypothetical protein LSCM1_06557 [Leishmania martiniquensis]|uniref:Uncharacterized protein n=1 Tax=Leishmania martiniquensis TaxID=1580590 RepID=A0A836HUY9_9TRYP|nr:hypothetical protein LSCM1_06557 [Leishmania martiniquensis]
MPRPVLSAHRDVQCRGGSVHRSAGNNNDARSSPGSTAAASLNVWVHTRLVDSTAQILAAQPADPLRVLSVSFSTEAVLAATYPATSAPTRAKELEAEAVGEANGVMAAVPASGAAKSTVFHSTSSPKLPIVMNGDTASAQTVEHLIEQSWVRRRMQPYGLYAVARCACPCPPLRLPPTTPGHLGVNMAPVESADGQDTASAEAPSAPTRPLLFQWMDIFALLHRQSRMSFAELAAEAARWNAQSKSAAVVPPVDYRAAEEIPTCEVLLCVMAVVEEHLRRAECGGAGSGAAGASRLCRRLQISVKLLALQLLAAFVDLQRSAESTQSGSRSSSSASAFDLEQEHDVDGSNHDGREKRTGDVDACHITRGVYLLSAHQLDELHQWLHCSLRAKIISPDSPHSAGITAAGGSNVCDGGSGEAVNVGAGSPLEDLKSRATAYLTRVLRNPARDTPASAGVPGVMSLDTFVAFMERMASVVVAHQQTGLAMAIALSARLPRRSPALAGEAQLPAWVMEHVSNCADAVAQRQTALQDGAMLDSTSATVPLAWRAYVNQIAELLAPYQRDVMAHLRREQREEETRRGTSGDSILRRLQRRLLSWAREAKYGHAKARERPTADDSSLRVLAAELVSAWVSHVFEAYAVTLYPT